MATNDKRTPNDTFSITPAKDEIASYQKNQGKHSLARSLGEVPDVASSSSSTSIKLTLTAVTLILILTVALAGFLQQRLKMAEQTLQLTEARVAELESRLSVTDESMGESAASMKVKIRDMDGEIRKLWDNVWKKSKQRFSALEAKQQNHNKSLNNVKSFIDSTEQQLTKNAKTTRQLSQKLTTLDKLNNKQVKNEKKLQSLESSLENANDKVNRFNTRMIKNERLGKDNKERLDAVDNFRRKVNVDLMKLNRSTP
ncbi:MAG: chromosome segregation ATPase [Pseudohongiellaceae bacterium]|jgi:chromosome segregation ATPase